MQFSTYHIVLRVSTLTLALVLLLESGLITPITKQLSDNTRSYLASAVGVQVAVAPNEFNVITAELTARQRELDRREADLSDREISVGLKDGEAETNGLSTFILSSILFVLLVLIVLNYALDYLRRSNIQPKSEQAT